VAGQSRGPAAGRPAHRPRDSSSERGPATRQEETPTLTPRDEHQRRPERLHGGIITAILDDLVGVVVMVVGVWAGRTLGKELDGL
jgi:hypothetical protein